MKKRILIISPHPDDETLGVGGIISKYSSMGSEFFILTVSGHMPPLYSEEDYNTTIKEAEKAYEVLGVKNYEFLDIPATMVSQEPVHKLNGNISSVINDFLPEIVLIPFPDRHIDHRVIFESSMVATRPVANGRKIEIVASYETLSETHWNAPFIEPNFYPNWVVDITEDIQKKIEALKCYESQISEFPGPRSLEAVEALAKFRGTQSGFAFGEALNIIRKVS